MWLVLLEWERILGMATEGRVKPADTFTLVSATLNLLDGIENSESASDRLVRGGTSRKVIKIRP